MPSAIDQAGNASASTATGSSGGNRSLFETTTLFRDHNGYLVAGWADQRLDPTGGAVASRRRHSNSGACADAHKV